MHKLWYKTEALTWNEALPLGNGRLGAMAYSGAFSEKFMFNEETLWGGYPHDRSTPEAAQYIPQLKELIQNKKYREADKLVTEKLIGTVASAYLPFGTLTVDLKKDSDFSMRYAPGDSSFSESTIKNYRRELDLKTAVVSSSFQFNGNTIARRAIVSKPDNVFAAEICAEQESSLHFDAYLSCAIDHSVKSGTDSVLITGRCPADIDYYAKEKGAQKYYYDEEKDTIPFCGIVKIVTDGSIVCSGGVLSVSHASSALILVSIQTGYSSWCKSPSKEGKDYLALCQKDISGASRFTFEELLRRHLEDYQPLYSRCEITLGEEDSRPTDELLRAAAAEKFPQSLAALMFHFSRYLLISCSREGTQPSNLQGIWNREIMPPWRSDYTVNINTEMNYWSAEMSGLPECHMPIFPFLKELSQAGRTSAKNHFGANGWVLCHNCDVWRLTSPAGIGAMHAFWPMGGLWLCREIWEHYDYTRDTEFLKENFETLTGALDFLCDWLYKGEDGFLTTVASTSPENRYVLDGELVSVSGITAMDIGIIDDFVTYTGKICEILGGKEDVKKKCDYIKKHLTPLKITSDGRIMEWNEEFQEHELGHRHISHMYALHPAGLIQEGTPLFDACKKTLKTRLENGGGHTGWSNAWIINQFARLLDGESAYQYVKNMFIKSTYKNLFDAHPPFQIDGNFGFAAGLGEMLVKSALDEITLLPAVSQEMDKGAVHGMRARGGYSVSFSWADGKISEYRITKDGSEIASGNNKPYPLKLSI